MMQMQMAADDNYIALFIAIYKGCTPDQAFDILYNGKIQRPPREEYDRETNEMLRLRRSGSGMSYKEIGEIFGVTDYAAYARVKRLEKKQKKTICV